MRQQTMRITLVVSLISWAPTSSADSAAIVTFATACSNCHEGECSGRLSFARNPEAAMAHIRQYAGPVTDDRGKALYLALERMKSSCSYAPLPPLDVRQGPSGHVLMSYRDPWTGAYFLPLGKLAAGSYRLLGTSSDSRIRIELIDNEFEPWADRSITPSAGRFDLAFHLPVNRSVFLRVRPHDRQPLARLTLLRD